MESCGSATRSTDTAPTVGASGTRRKAPRSCFPARRRSTAPTSASSSPETPQVPDATELELTAQELRDAHSDSILDTEFHRGRAVLVVNPLRIKAVLENLQGKGYRSLASLPGLDSHP